jgi:PhnB protein
MSKSKSYIPDGAQHVTPQLVVKDAQKFAELLVEEFGAQKLAWYPHLDGKGVMFAVIQLGTSKIFLSDARTGFAEPTKANLFVYVPDVDATVAKLAAKGAKIVAPPMDMPWGDRWSMVEDPDGNKWQIAKSLETLTPAEVRKRMEAAAAAQQQASASAE